SELVLDDGRFGVGVDGGTFDFSIRSTPDSFFPWVVLPGLAVDLASGGPSLGTVTMPYPVVLTGAIAAPDGTPLAGASVAARIPTGDTQPPRYIEIGEVVTDASGRYFLPLPPSVKGAASGP